MGKEVEVNGNVVVVEKIGWLVGFNINLFFCNVDILCLEILWILWIKSNYINGNDE